MAKYYKKRVFKKKVGKQARAVVKASRMLMLKSVETKAFVVNNSQVLGNNQIFSLSLTQQIAVGNTSVTRVGDSILLGSLTLSGELTAYATIQSVKYRVIVGYTRNTVANGSSMIQGILGYGDIFYSVGTPGYLAHGVVNPQAFTALYDEMIDLNSDSAQVHLRSFYTRINLKMSKFDYATQGGSLGKVKNLSFVIVPLAFPFTQSAAIGELQSIQVLKFKDP
ncbi:hypothetical protein [Circovirus-like genome DHCV-6]|uniref:Uncharacterized protein n=1 Tax=Circovirus-like genome DHCV-6 TaxID=1788455 RepID=A0A190WHH1_9VIRU|nr:hypothetical protein [Circovirus-like genome DHCV-6]AMB43011.1 hypothetical protein [Circovirus-like genome DHCV-6]